MFLYQLAEERFSQHLENHFSSREEPFKVEGLPCGYSNDELSRA
jgi:hypothetical protein